MSASSKKKLRKEQNAATMTEKQLAQQKEDKKLKIATIAFVAVMVVVICIAIGSLGLRAYDKSGITERNTVAMTVNDHELPSAELNYFYIECINEAYSKWYEQYGSYVSLYMSMYGLDMTKPLNTQYIDAAKTMTWADYFVEAAVAKATSAYAQYDKAMADPNFTLDEQLKAALDTMPETLKLEAEEAEYASVQDYLTSMYGIGTTEEGYIKFVEIMTVANAYSTAYYDSLEYTADEIDAHDAEHAKEYNTYSFAYSYLNAADFREGGTPGADGNVTYSDEEVAAAVEAAKTAADDLAQATSLENFDQRVGIVKANISNETTTSTKVEDAFIANVNSLYTDWLSDESRKVGDIGVFASTSTSEQDGKSVTVTNGYYVVYFTGVNDNEINLVDVRHILVGFQSATNSSTYTEEEKNTAKTKAEAVLTEWKNGAATEESFAALVGANSTDSGSMAKGGLYEDVYPGQMVTNFNDWCFDSSRKAGDVEIVETEYGYHVMYFVGTKDVTYRDYMITSAMKSEDLNTWTQDIFDAAKAVVLDTSKLSLDLIMTPSSY